MALQINELCVSCWACEPLCPNRAIYEVLPHFSEALDIPRERGGFQEALVIPRGRGGFQEALDIPRERGGFQIDPAKCTECLGEFDEPQCAAICPIECCIVDALGEPLNPPGSLTGIPPGKIAETIARLQAH